MDKKEVLMKTITVTDARKNLYRLIDQVNQSHEPVYILGKRATGVLVGEKDWSCMQEALQILTNTELRESIFHGLALGIADCIRKPDTGPVPVFYTPSADEDVQEIETSGFGEDMETLLHLLGSAPLQDPPAVGRLFGELSDVYCRKISIHHRLLYEIEPELSWVKVLRICSVYNKPSV
jgi:antitoxin YefM